MPKTKTTSPSRSLGTTTPKRKTTRGSRSLCSPALSTGSGRLTSLIDQFKDKNMESFALSPLNGRSVLNDNTEIEEPRRKSWWKKLDENSQDVMEVLEDNRLTVNNAIEDVIDIEVLSQEKKNFTLDLPESSDNESINSIVLPQRRLFTQKENQPQKKYGNLIDNRESLAKLHKTNTANIDKTVNVGTRELFQNAKRSKPIFPSALLNISPNKTAADKTRENVLADPKPQVRNIFGNRPANKRKNMFADFIVSESEDEIPEIQPKVFGFQKKLEQRRISSISKGRDASPASSITTDIEMDFRMLLPSSTMVENQLEDNMLADNTPIKRARLSKLSEAKESEAGTLQTNTTSDKTKQSDKSVASKDKSKASPDIKDKSLNSSRTTRSMLKNASKRDDNVNTPVKQDARGNKSRSKISSKGNELDVSPSKSDTDKQNTTLNKSQKQNKSRTRNSSKAIETEIGSEEIVVNAINNVTRVINKSTNKSLPNTTATNKSVNEKERTVTLKVHDKVNKTGSNDVEHSEQDDNENNFTLQFENDDEVVEEAVVHNDLNEHQKHNIKKHNTVVLEKDSQETEINHSKSNKSSLTNITLQQKPAKIVEESVESQTEKYSADDNVDGNQEQETETVQNKNEIVNQEIDEDVINSSEDINEEIEQEDEANVSEENEELVNESEEDANESEDEAIVSQENEDEQNESQEKVVNESTEVENVENESEEEEEEHNENGEEEEEGNESEVGEDEPNESQEVEAEVNESQEVEQDIDNSREIEEEANESQEVEAEVNKSQKIEEETNENQEIEKEANESQDIEAEANENQEDEEEANESQEAKEEANGSQEIDEEAHESKDVVDADASDENDEEVNEASADESQEVENDGEESHEVESEAESEEVEDDQQMDDSDEADKAIASDPEISDDNQADEMEIDDDDEGEQESDNESEQNEHESHEEPQIEEQNEIEPSDEIEESPNVTHDTTGRHRKKQVNKSPEVILHDKTNQNDSFSVKGRNTSVRKTKSMIKNLNIRPSLAPSRDSAGFSDGTRNSSAEGSGWDSHRTTRKTLRQTFGKDFTPRKSLRALVMEKSAKRQTEHLEMHSETVKFPLANSTEMPEDSNHHVEDIVESDHEVSRRTRQTTLEMYLQKMKEQNIEKKFKMEQAVRNSLKSSVTNSLSLFKVPNKPAPRRAKPTQSKAKKQLKSIIPFDELPSEVIEDMKYKPPKRFQPTNASWITKRLYKFLENKLEGKYDYKARVRAEKLVETIYFFAKDLRRHDVAPTDAVDVLKHELARLEVVRTHFEFYEFFHEFMPREVRVKVVPDIVNKIALPRHGVFSDILRGKTVHG